MKKRILCVLLCLCLLPLFSALAEEPAPRVRVLLKRLNITDRMDLITDGAYTVRLGTGSSLLLPRGSAVTVVCRGQELILFVGGMSLSAGKSAVFVRNADGSGKVNAIRFEKNGKLYPGDLELTAVGGQIQPVLTLSVEDYLIGVVPYEMSNDFPLEALKAQAVCARTYVISHLNPQKAWDVTDTTNDQVFKGLDPRDENAIRAVQETAGLIGMTGRDPATCYYSASNGGQTDLPSHVWPGSPDTGYAIAEDPYDVENPESITLRLKIRKDGNLPDGPLKDAVRKALYPLLVKDGYTGTEEQIALSGVLSVELTAPRYEAPSRLMTKLKLTVTVRGMDGATPIPETTPAPADPLEEDDISLFAAEDRIPKYTVELELFPRLIGDLKLSIYGGNNEILTVTEENQQFVVSSGRYGHGVGMSQRGAEWMAKKYGLTYLDILAFYYPGMTLAKAGTGERALPTADPALRETPGPAATATPRPTVIPVSGENLPEGAYLASVENIADDSSLNLRAEPSPVGEILTRLYKHQRLIVLETCEDPEWVHVRIGDGPEGYVKVAFTEKVN